MKLFKKNKVGKKIKGARVIGGVHKANTTTSPKTIEGVRKERRRVWLR